jgi:hypothetical protein
MSITSVAEPSLSSLQSPSIVRTEFLTPLSHRLIGHEDSALGQTILDIPEAQAEAMISPDRIANDLGRKTMAGMAPVFRFRAEVDKVARATLKAYVVLITAVCGSRGPLTALH